MSAGARISIDVGEAIRRQSIEYNVDTIFWNIVTKCLF